MPRIDQIDDLDTIKQAALLLEKENARLHKRLRALLSENAALRGEEGQKQYELELVRLQEQLNAMQRKLYGASTERRPKGKNKKRDKDRATPPSGRREQKSLPIEEVSHHLDEADCVCAECGKELCVWEGQTEDSEEIDVVTRSFVLKKHRKQKYRCQCGAAPVTAPGPLRLPGGGLYSIDFAIEAALSKYWLHVPLERQVRDMMRSGLDMSTSTLWDQLEKLARVLDLSYEALQGYVVKNSLVHADETRWRLLKSGGKTWWVWSISRHDAVYYRLNPSRGHEVVVDLLDGFDGVLMVDDYAGYQAARKLLPKTILVLCWAHVRRKFVTAAASYPECDEALEHIDRLFEIERDLPNWQVITDPKLRKNALIQIQGTRAQRSKPIVGALLAWAKEQRSLPGSTLRNALEYMTTNWADLIRFIVEPRAPMSNNAAERTLRGPVVGRKNHLGSKSQRGTQVAALFYSLIESAKLSGKDPAAYLRAAVEAAITRGQPLLPHEMGR
jgi:transposase